MAWWPKVERREAQRPTSLGARSWRHQLRKAGPLLRLKGCLVSTLAPPAAPSPRGFPRGTGKPRTHRAARTKRLGCLKLWIKIGSEALPKPRPALAGRGRRASSDAWRVRGEALRPPIQNLSGRKFYDATSTTRESIDYMDRTASPLTRSLRCASASTSPRKRAGRG
jgi:hypothetical protein